MSAITAEHSVPPPAAKPETSSASERMPRSSIALSAGLHIGLFALIQVTASGWIGDPPGKYSRLPVRGYDSAGKDRTRAIERETGRESLRGTIAKNDNRRIRIV